MRRYSGGVACHHNSFLRSTTIQFVCDHSAGLGQPAFLAVSTHDSIAVTVAWLFKALIAVYLFVPYVDVFSLLDALTCSLLQELDSCDYLFSWPTALACLPVVRNSLL